MSTKNIKSTEVDLDHRLEIVTKEIDHDLMKTKERDQYRMKTKEIDHDLVKTKEIDLDLMKTKERDHDQILHQIQRM